MLSFDNVCHERLEELLRIRIGDPKLLTLIRRFLKAGVMIEGQRFDTEDGVPQGASLTPPTKVQNSHIAVTASLPRKKGEVDAVDDSDLSWLDQHPGNQSAEYFPLC